MATLRYALDRCQQIGVVQLRRVLPRLTYSEWCKQTGWWGRLTASNWEDWVQPHRDASRARHVYALQVNVLKKQYVKQCPFLEG